MPTKKATAMANATYDIVFMVTPFCLITTGQVMKWASIVPGRAAWRTKVTGEPRPVRSTANGPSVLTAWFGCSLRLHMLVLRNGTRYHMKQRVHRRDRNFKM